MTLKNIAKSKTGAMVPKTFFFLLFILKLNFFLLFGLFFQYDNSEFTKSMIYRKL